MVIFGPFRLVPAIDSIWLWFSLRETLPSCEGWQPQPLLYPLRFSLPIDVMQDLI